MSKAKFKVGDKVKILDVRKVDNHAYGSCDKMVALKGKTSVVSEVIKPIRDWGYAYLLKDNVWTWDERALELVKPETIVIYRNASEVVAVNKVTGKKGVAKCSPLDEFDFETGAKLRFERLITPEPKLYNGKVICTDSRGWKYYTTGKIYQFKDGKATFDNGFTFKNDFETDPVKTFEDWVKRSDAKWLEVVE